MLVHLWYRTQSPTKCAPWWGCLSSLLLWHFSINPSLDCIFLYRNALKHEPLTINYTKCWRMSLSIVLIKLLIGNQSFDLSKFEPVFRKTSNIRKIFFIFDYFLCKIENRFIFRIGIYALLLICALKPCCDNVWTFRHFITQTSSTYSFSLSLMYNIWGYTSWQRFSFENNKVFIFLILSCLFNPNKVLCVSVHVNLILSV